MTEQPVSATFLIPKADGYGFCRLNQVDACRAVGMPMAGKA
jgi:hypothetical protein